ncbi:MAG: DUF1549 domain-containing protein [Candidatus Hydrogenedens sp.]|nr:DUF1549 domain-containing protein [Candidatus Hydrogenedens sp.]
MSMVFAVSPGRRSLSVAALTAYTLGASAAGWCDPAEFFESKVRPVLAERCYSCHGAEKQKASLRLDHISVILQGGESGPVLAPGKPDESRLYQAVSYADVDLQMPPKGKLPDEEIAVLRTWIEQGAYWPDEAFNPEGAAPAASFDVQALKAEHWAWQPIKAVEPPAVQDAAWPKSPIDNFLLARLESEGYTPAPEADKATLIRRLYFDLTGLPPSPETVQSFIDDPSPGAYEAVVDQLLASPAYGERWARHWLDLIRYADTYGHEQDYPIRYAWEYRDYVIRALNRDVPYDALVKEHLAGDLLPNPRMSDDGRLDESILGTGFLFFHQATHAPVDVRKDQADRIDNQIDVISKAFLGMTVSCARCHDHKFDAISAKDYYALAGFMRSTRQLDAHLDPGGEIARAAEQVRSERERGGRALKQVMHTASKSEQHIADYLLAAHAAAGQEDEAAAIESQARERSLDSTRLRRWSEALSDKRVQSPAHPMNLWRTASDAAHAPADEAFLRGARQPEGAAPQADTYEVYADFNDSASLEGWTTEGEAFQGALATAPAWFDDKGKPQLAPGGIVHSGLTSNKLQGTLRSPNFTIEHDSIHYRVAGRGADIRLVIEGYQLRDYNGLLFESTLYTPDTGSQFTWFHQVNGIGKFKGRQAYIELRDNGGGWIALDEIRFSDSAPPSAESEAAGSRMLQDKNIKSLGSLAGAYAARIGDALARAVDDQASPEELLLVDWLLEYDLLDGGRSESRLARAMEDLREVEQSIPEPYRAHVAAEGTPENEFVHLRGNYKTPGEEVPRRFLEALGGDQPLGGPDRSGRLALAEAMFSNENPLPARVLVNRVWHHLFGRGIVPSVDNFGVLGAPPSHPELLDYLAAGFRDDGWSMKHLVKRVVMTSAYRMSSSPTDASAEERDPDNILLHRMNRRRLEGEAVRDAILASAGTLDSTMFGYPVAAYISPYSEGNRRPEVSGPEDGDRRRSIYIEVRRNYLTPVLLAFDFPVPDSTHGNRTTSNVPAQALMLMNDPFVVDQAAALGATIAGLENKGFAEKLSALFERTLGRPPTEAETTRMEAFAKSQAESRGVPAEQYESDAQLWADLSHVVFTLKEFIFIG